MEFLEFFNDLERAKGTNEKIRILSTATDMHKELLYYCFNPYLNYGIRKLPNLPPNNKKLLTDEEAAKVFLSFVKNAVYKNNSLNHIHDFTTMYSEFDDTQRKWFGRVLLKNLRVGIHVKSIEKALPGFKIPKFEVQLAGRYGEGTIQDVPFLPANFIVQPKLDGYRAIYKDGLFFGRSGKFIANADLKRKLDKETSGLSDYVLDGELYSHSRNFSEISTILDTVDVPIPDDLKFFVWDMIPLSDWSLQSCHSTNEERFEKLKNTEFNSDFIKVIESYTIGGIGGNNELKRFYQKMMAQGHEGLVLKDPAGFYMWGKRKGLYKVKPVEYADGIIIGYIEGKGRLKGNIGSLEVYVPEFDLEVDVGGLPDAIRNKINSNISEYIDSWIEFKYSKLSYKKGSKTPTGFRHPRFNRLRDSK